MNRFYETTMDRLRVLGYWEMANLSVVLVNKHYVFSRHHRMVDVMMCAASRPIVYAASENQRACYNSTKNEFDFYFPERFVEFKARKFQRRMTLKQWATRMWGKKSMRVSRIETEYRGYKANGCVIFDMGDQTPLAFFDFGAEYQTRGEGSNFVVKYDKPISISADVMQ